MRVSRLEQKGEVRRPYTSGRNFLSTQVMVQSLLLRWGDWKIACACLILVCLPPDSRTMRRLVNSIFGEGRWGDKA